MTVFKHFIKAVRKNIFSLFIYGIIFVVVLFSYAQDDKTIVYEEATMNVIIDDRAHDKVSDAINKFLEANNISYKKMTDADKEMAVSQGEVDLIVTINEGAEESLLKEPKRAVSIYQSSWLSGQNGGYKLYEFISYLRYYGLDTNKAFDMMNTSANVVMLDKKDSEVDLNYFYKFAGFILTSMLMFNISLVNTSLNEESFYKRTIVSPITSSSYNAQMMLGQLVIALAMNVLLILVIRLVIKEAQPNLWLTSLNFLVYTISVLGMVNLLSAISNKKQVIVAIANVFSMLLATTGGAFIPIEFLPEWMVNLGKVFPFYYFGKNADVHVFDGVFLRNLVIMLVMALVFFLIGNWRLKIKRRSE